MKILIHVINKFVDLIIFIIFIGLLIFSVYVLNESQQVNSVGSTKLYEKYKPSETEEVNFETLVEQNPDVIAWLTVDGTGIDYPVLQSEIDNYEYLQKNPLGETAAAGSLFLDVNNSSNFTDTVSIIYGHHMENSLMFGDLDKFEDENFFNTHQYGNLYFNGLNHKVEFMAFVLTSAYDKVIYTPNNGETDLKDYILSKAKNKRVVDGSNLLILTTCDGNVTNGRYVLVGVIENN